MFLAGDACYSMSADGNNKQITSGVLSYYPREASSSAKQYNGRRRYRIAMVNANGTGRLSSSQYTLQVDVTVVSRFLDTQRVAWFGPPTERESSSASLTPSAESG